MISGTKSITNIVLIFSTTKKQTEKTLDRSTKKSLPFFPSMCTTFYETQQKKSYLKFELNL